MPGSAIGTKNSEMHGMEHALKVLTFFAGNADNVEKNKVQKKP